MYGKGRYGLFGSIRSGVSHYFTVNTSDLHGYRPRGVTGCTPGLEIRDKKRTTDESLHFSDIVFSGCLLEYPFLPFFFSFINTNIVYFSLSL